MVGWVCREWNGVGGGVGVVRKWVGMEWRILDLFQVMEYVNVAISKVTAIPRMSQKTRI